MRNLKRLGTLFLTLALILGLCSAALAAVEDTGFSDVDDADAWCADAVEYVRDNELMSGTSDTTFSPNGTMTRAMLAAVLYRMAGSPAVSGSDSFTDTADGTWYADAILWASDEGVMSGYGGGLFGANDPVNREQIAAILWRYTGSPPPLVWQSPMRMKRPSVLTRSAPLPGSERTESSTGPMATALPPRATPPAPRWRPS